ncbi:MAG TPA: hypothetical protein ENK18_13620 [Deltaproteobacteria bacterium]|nr:hypothetical protein [Deltaproteobacteria bacterium]
MESVRWVVLLGLCACSGPQGEPEGDEPDDIDLFMEAYGGCSSTITRQLNDQPAGSAEYAYNDDGDLVKVIWAGGEDFTPQTKTWAYGAPHEESRMTVRFESDGSSDYKMTYEWQDGRIVEQRYDRGIDGQVDWIERVEYDDHGLAVLYEWDLDGDEVFEDTVALTWQANGKEWYGVGEGIDPEGLYAIEYWADANAVNYRYTYTDDRGVSADWELLGRNRLGIWAHIEDRVSRQGIDAEEEISDQSFDKQGREIETNMTRTYTEEGGPTTLETEILIYTYDCP